MPPWPARLVFVQLAVVYFFNGVYKLRGPDWVNGSAMDLVLADPGWSRWPNVLPHGAARWLTWAVLVWELGFPVFVLSPWARPWALWAGVVFHVGSGLHLELGPFPAYALCYYLPLVPWERWSFLPKLRRGAGPAGAGSPGPAV